VAVLPIRIYGDPVLRQQAKPIESINGSLSMLARNMVETMFEDQGIGLAAPQIGQPIRLIVADFSLGQDRQHAVAMMNPQIIGKEGEETYEEGCLSIPGIHGDVIRAAQIGVRFLDIHGNPHEIECQGLAARVVLHETDHLDGVLFVDRINPLRRRMLQGKLKKLAKGERPDQEEKQGSLL
jgi:peptide deformylase